MPRRTLCASASVATLPLRAAFYGLTRRSVCALRPFYVNDCSARKRRAPRGNSAAPDTAEVAETKKWPETKLRSPPRVRPLRSEEGGACAWRIEGENVYQADCEEVVGRTAFRYDAVYGENSATKDVYEGVCRELVDGALRGVNGTIFAYGQTSSGKTFTMQGGDKYGAGARRASCTSPADHIFSVIGAERLTDFLLREVSYLGVTQRAAPRLTGRGRHGGSPHPRAPRDGVYVEGAQETVVTQPHDMAALGPGREAAGRRRDGHERAIVKVAHGL